MPKDKTVVIGQSVKRIDALGKVIGETTYPGDIDIEGQLWMRIKFSDRAHARVLNVDTTQAESLEGVVRENLSINIIAKAIIDEKPQKYPIAYSFFSPM